MSCPWSWLPHSPAAFCEESLCSWIRQPGNTWSNAGFFLVAWLIYRDRSVGLRPPSPATPRSLVDREHRHLRDVAHITLLTGIGSTIFHATETWIGALLDYVGMFLGGAFMVTVCVTRLLHPTRRAIRLFYWIFALSGVVVFLIDESLARWDYMIQGVICVVLEVSLFFTHARAREYRWLAVAWAFFTPAMILWTMDVDGSLCDPQNHVLSGHAAWHLLNAAAFYASWRYYQQFEALRRFAPGN